MWAGRGGGGGAADGGFPLTILTGGAHFAVVVDGDDRAVYMGLLDEDDTAIDTDSTARALLFQAIGGPLLPDEARETVFDDPDFVADAATLAAAIADAYTAGGTDLEDIADEVAAALATLTLLAEEKRLAIDKTSVNPPGGHSGIDLDTTVEHQLTLHNNYRRRALAWVDLVEGVDDAGATVTYDQQVAELDVSPTTAFTSVIGTLIDAVYGNYMWAPVASDPIPTPVMPSGGRETTYRVTVLGLGSSWGDYESLSAERQDRFTMLALRSIFADFVTPIIVNLAIPAQATRIDDFLEWYGGSAVLGDLIGAVASTAPGIAEKALDGDFDGAVHDAINWVFTTGTVNNVAMQNWSQAILDHYGVSAANQFATAGNTVLRYLTIVNAVGTVLDSARQVRDIAASHVADEWDVVVTEARLTLTPNSLTIQPWETAPFTVTVQDAGDRIFEYRWFCGAGELSDGIHQGDEIVTSSATVNYQALVETEDAVWVEVFEIQMPGGERLRLGDAASPVIVREAAPYLAPRRTALRPGDRELFEVRFEEGFEADGPMFYRWTGADQHGSHDGSGIIGTFQSVTYLAETEGVDNLSCEVFISVNGRMESIGAAGAEIRVELVPSIIQGSYRTQVWHSEDGESYGVYADVVWEAFDDATHYTLYGYGGDDPDHYHQGPIVRTVYANNVIHDHVDEMPAGEIWMSLSGAWGHVSGEAGAIAWMESRFGSRWEWDVEIFR